MATTDPNHDTPAEGKPKNPETAAVEAAADAALAQLVSEALRNRKKRKRQLSLVSEDMDSELHRVAADEELATRARLADLLGAALKREAARCRLDVIERMKDAKVITTASLEDAGVRTMSIRVKTSLRVDRNEDAE